MESFDDGALLVFADGDRMVRYADYRGRGEFEGLPAGRWLPGARRRSSAYATR